MLCRIVRANSSNIGSGITFLRLRNQPSDQRLPLVDNPNQPPHRRIGLLLVINPGQVARRRHEVHHRHRTFLHLRTGCIRRPITAFALNHGFCPLTAHCAKRSRYAPSSVHPVSLPPRYFASTSHFPTPPRSPCTNTHPESFAATSPPPPSDAETPSSPRSTPTRPRAC
jgi:hypothetical protein